MLVLDNCSESSNKMPFIRRKRNHSASVRNNQIEVQGLAWLCFAQDHSWFQGNILTDDESNYSLYGRKVCAPVKEQDDEMKEQNGEDDSFDNVELDEKLEQLIIRSNVAVANRRGHRGSSTCSTSSSCEELEAIEEELNNNDLPKGTPTDKKSSSSCSSPSSSSKIEEYYSVTLTDHFSGLRYTLPRISVNNDRDERGEKDDKSDLFICADGQVSFEIENIFKGQKADMMIQKHIGSPSLLGQKCLVYHGAIMIVHNEIVDVGRSWCL